MRNTILYNSVEYNFGLVLGYFLEELITLSYKKVTDMVMLRAVVRLCLFHSCMLACLHFKVHKNAMLSEN